jgi:hypothetical protein
MSNWRLTPYAFLYPGLRAKSKILSLAPEELAVKCYNKLYGSIRGWTEYKRCFSEISTSMQEKEKNQEKLFYYCLLR